MTLSILEIKKLKEFLNYLPDNILDNIDFYLNSDRELVINFDNKLYNLFISYCFMGDLDD